MKHLIYFLGYDNFLCTNLLQDSSKSFTIKVSFCVFSKNNREEWFLKGWDYFLFKICGNVLYIILNQTKAEFFFFKYQIHALIIWLYSPFFKLILWMLHNYLRKFSLILFLVIINTWNYGCIVQYNRYCMTHNSPRGFY
jgi:hypothetical protein